MGILIKLSSLVSLVKGEAQLERARRRWIVPRKEMSSVGWMGTVSPLLDLERGGTGT